MEFNLLFCCNFYPISNNTANKQRAYILERDISQRERLTHPKFRACNVVTFIHRWNIIPWTVFNFLGVILYMHKTLFKKCMISYFPSRGPLRFDRELFEDRYFSYNFTSYSTRKRFSKVIYLPRKIVLCQ